MKCNQRPAVVTDPLLGEVCARCWSEAGDPDPEPATPAPDSSLLPCPRLLGDPDQWDDSTMDALAAVEAVREDRGADAALVISCTDIVGYAVTLTKLLAAALDDTNTDRAFFRHWALRAVRRPLCHFLPAR